MGIPGAAADSSSADSIKQAAALVAEDLMSFYEGSIPGILDGPPPDGDYYWWSGGALWGEMLDYWYHTGETTYNAQTSEGLAFQAGPDNNYMPMNWSASMGNDDQAIWALSAVLADETQFQEPEADKWSTLATNVFASHTERKITEGGCAGALRWQIFPMNVGYDYVSSKWKQHVSIAFINL
jgi:mannan endo-1,6-alpha-mannosidase